MSKHEEQVKLVNEIMERIEQLRNSSTEGDGLRLFAHIVYKHGDDPNGVMLNSAIRGDSSDLIKSLLQDDNFKTVMEHLYIYLNDEYEEEK